MKKNDLQEPWTLLPKGNQPGQERNLWFEGGPTISVAPHGAERTIMEWNKGNSAREDRRTGAIKSLVDHRSCDVSLWDTAECRRGPCARQEVPFEGSKGAQPNHCLSDINELVPYLAVKDRTHMDRMSSPTCRVRLADTHGCSQWVRSRNLDTRG